jgi:HAE1 family hydrophobic/amphiphilic exporter-1
VRGSREIWFTILSMTISLAAVFIPASIHGRILGRLFREFAVTICVAVLISGFVSISLTPMLCSRVLRPLREREHRNFIANPSRAPFNGCRIFTAAHCGRRCATERG